MKKPNGIYRAVWVVGAMGILSILAATHCAWGQVDTPAAAAATTVVKKPAPAWAKHVPAGARVTEQGWFAPVKGEVTQAKRQALPDEVTKAYVIPVREEISGKIFKKIERKASRCRGAGAQLIVLDMDTWGGEVGAALDIARFIKVNLNDIYVVCYVRTRAVSAGALIALACDEIVMTDVGKLGACAPLIQGGKLEGVEREKIETVLRTEFEESANRNGYSVPLAVSMISNKLEVWLVRNIETHELRYVLASRFREEVQNPPAPTGQSDSATPGKTSEDAKWTFLKRVLPKGELLTMPSKKAKRFGFISEILPTTPSGGDPYAPLVKRYNITTPPVVLEDNWSEELVGFLTHPVVSGILIFGVLLFGYTEMHTPGFGVFGGIAIVCLVTLLCSRFLIGMANWWELALFALGMVLIALEVFVIPGFGIAGISGIFLCIFGLLAMLVPNMPDKLPIPDTAWMWDGFTTGILTLFLSFLSFLVAAAFLSKYLPKVPLFTKSKLILAAASAADHAPRADDSPLLRLEIGAYGKAVTPLRPVGTVRFGEDLLDAMCEGTIIDSGARVRVVRREGNRIVVEERKMT